MSLLSLHQSEHIPFGVTDCQPVKQQEESTAAHECGCGVALDTHDGVPELTLSELDISWLWFCFSLEISLICPQFKWTFVN